MGLKMYHLGVKNDFKQNHKFQEVLYIMDRDISLVFLLQGDIF